MDFNKIAQDAFVDELQKIAWNPGTFASGVSSAGSRVIDRVGSRMLGGGSSSVQSGVEHLGVLPKGVTPTAPRATFNRNDKGVVELAGQPKSMTKASSFQLDVGDIEDRLGIVLGGDHEHKAQGLVDQELARSFILRHPFLTGIPTLGIAPAIATESALDRIQRRLTRDDSELAHAVARSHREDIETQIKSDEANRYSNAARNIGTAGILAAYVLNKNKGD